MRAVMMVILLASMTTASAETNFVSLSDIHFNPFYDPSLVDDLVAASPGDWDAIFRTSTITTPSAYGNDTNYPLYQMMIAEVKARTPRPRFVIISGDFLAHDFQQQFQTTSTDKSNATQKLFAAKTVQYMATSIISAFPHTPIYPSLGNNDSDCGDYEITPKSAFLMAFMGSWRKSIHSKSSFPEFSVAGYYWADPPGLARTRLIVLNTILFSTDYTNACNTSDKTDWGAAQLKWLEATLKEAAAQRRRVWMLYHIPPGINVYPTIKHGEACPTPETFWKPEYATKFASLIADARLTASFAGHTHMDDFRVKDGQFIHITPSISPMFTNNPGYDMFTAENGLPKNYTAYYFSLGDANPQWQREYDFTTAYAQPKYDAASLSNVVAAVNASETTRTMFMKFYTSSNTSSDTITPSNWRGYWCGDQSFTPADFSSCYCPPPRPPSQ